MTIETAIGPAGVLHQLALGVECFDAVSGSALRTPVRVGRQVPARLQHGTKRLDPPKAPHDTWPCAELERSAPGRFRLRYGPSVRGVVVLRVDDPSRCYVPRRFSVHLWPIAAVNALPSAGPYIPVLSRVLRVWLSPGPAQQFPRGTTLVRGRVSRQGAPVRWARVTATGPNGKVAGRAHADDRGEFLLAVTDADQNPLQDSVALDLVATAPKVPAPLDLADRVADLPVEIIARSVVPPVPGNLDNPLLRGISPPPGYVPSALAVHAVVPMGTEFKLAADVPFSP